MKPEVFTHPVAQDSWVDLASKVTRAAADLAPALLRLKAMSMLLNEAEGRPDILLIIVQQDFSDMDAAIKNMASAFASGKKSDDKEATNAAA